MKIALITPGIFPFVIGGIQKHSYHLARNLARLGVKIDLYHTNFSSDAPVSHLEGFSCQELECISNIWLPWHDRSRIPGHYLRATRRFSRLVFEKTKQTKDVDLIYGQGITACEVVARKAREESIPPVIVNVHGFGMWQRTPSFHAWLQSKFLTPSFRRCLKQADYVASLGGELTAIAEGKVGISREKILEMPGGIDNEWLVDSPPLTKTGPRRFLFVGRYERGKGIEELSRAIQLSPQWKESATFRFVGPIPEEKKLSLPHVSYAGAITETGALKDEFAQSDALICPSFAEGMPTVVLEALGSGLAIIATDVGATGLLVSNNNGILLPCPSIKRITEGINSILQLSVPELDQLKKQSAILSKEFTWDRIAKNTLSQFEKVIRA